MTAAGALIRVWFVMRHKGNAPLWPVLAGLGVIFSLGIFLVPVKENSQGEVKFEDVRKIIDARCAGCHAAKPTFQGLNEAPKGVVLDTPERIGAQAAPIYQQTVQTRAMPPGNLTQMTEEERRLLDRWYRAR